MLNRSAFVSPELTARVSKAVGELDYTPNHLARSLLTRQSKTIGMLIPDIANPFYAKVVRGVEDKLAGAGYSLLLGNTYAGRAPRAFTADRVTGDNVRGMKMVTEHMIASGRNRIAMVTGHRVLTTTHDRIRGWRSALKKAGLTPVKEFAAEGDWTADSGYTVTMRLLTSELSQDAIVASNFLMMTGVLRALSGTRAALSPGRGSREL